MSDYSYTDYEYESSSEDEESKMERFEAFKIRYNEWKEKQLWSEGDFEQDSNDETFYVKRSAVVSANDEMFSYDYGRPSSLEDSASLKRELKISEPPFDLEVHQITEDYFAGRGVFKVEVPRVESSISEQRECWIRDHKPKTLDQKALEEWKSLPVSFADWEEKFKSMRRKFYVRKYRWFYTTMERVLRGLGLRTSETFMSRSLAYNFLSRKMSIETALRLPVFPGSILNAVLYKMGLQNLCVDDIFFAEKLSNESIILAVLPKGAAEAFHDDMIWFSACRCRFMSHFPNLSSVSNSLLVDVII